MKNTTSSSPINTSLLAINTFKKENILKAISENEGKTGSYSKEESTFLLQVAIYQLLKFIKVSDQMKSYTNAKHEEELALLTVLSKKRKEELEGEASTSRPTTTKKQKIFDLLKTLSNKATRLYKKYPSLGVLEKSLCMLSYNSIVFISEETRVFVNCDKKIVDNFETDNEFGDYEVIFDEGLLNTIEKHLELSTAIEEKYFDSLKFVPMAKDGFERRIYRTYSRWLELFTYQNDTINSWKTMTELDIQTRFYEPFFSILFEDSSLKIKYGESENSESKAVAKAIISPGSRGPFKVDERIVTVYNNKSYDLANIEFAKDGDVEKKCVEDQVKLIVEGKCIIDQITRLARLSQNKAKKLRVINIQFCGMKDAVIRVWLEKDGRGYVAQKLSPTLRLPTSPAMIPTFMNTLIPSVIKVKECAETTRKHFVTV